MSRFSRISRMAVTGSTNEDMARILGEDDAKGLTLVADYQERGTGRKGRAWIAPPGTALLCTIGLPDPLSTADLWIVPFWIALAVRAAITELGIDATLQWPNDVLVDGRKVAGILCISRVMGDYAWAACGIGVNVRRPDDDVTLAQIQPPPAFLSDRANVDRASLLQAILGYADSTYDDLRSPVSVVRSWEAAAHIPGAHYRVAVDGDAGSFDASALRLLHGGALLVEHNGAEREISLADARIVRG